jgi:hypothetical protein
VRSAIYEEQDHSYNTVMYFVAAAAREQLYLRLRKARHGPQSEASYTKTFLSANYLCSPEILWGVVINSWKLLYAGGH